MRSGLKKSTIVDVYQRVPRVRFATLGYGMKPVPGRKRAGLRDEGTG